MKNKKPNSHDEFHLKDYPTNAWLAIPIKVFFNCNVSSKTIKRRLAFIYSRYL